jgi:hypothetical protein
VTDTPWWLWGGITLLAPWGPLVAARFAGWLRRRSRYRALFDGLSTDEWGVLKELRPFGGSKTCIAHTHGEASGLLARELERKGLLEALPGERGAWGVPADVAAYYTAYKNVGQR